MSVANGIKSFHNFLFFFFLQLIKQSQIILNFLAVEARITNEHIDYIWAATQVC